MKKELPKVNPAKVKKLNEGVEPKTKRAKKPKDFKDEPVIKKDLKTKDNADNLVWVNSGDAEKALAKNRIIPSVPPDKRAKLNEGIDKKDKKHILRIEVPDIYRLPVIKKSDTYGYHPTDTLDTTNPPTQDKVQKDIWVPSRELKDVIKTDLLLCSCHSDEHQIIIHHDLEDRLVYLHIHLAGRPFFKRLIAGVKYIFGYKCRYGAWDEMILTSDQAEPFQKIYKTLKGLNTIHKPKNKGD